MGKAGKTVLTGVLLLAAAGPVQAQSKAAELLDAERALRQDESRRLSAMMHADTAALGRYLAHELVYTHSNAMVESRAEHLSAIASRKTIYQVIAPVELSYRWIGPAAVGTGVVTSKGTLAGTPFDVTLRVTTVHVRRDGRWQLVAWQSTRVP